MKLLAKELSIQVKDEGGELQFFGQQILTKEKTGTVIVFPSYMVHKVNPVTKGTRYSLVAWFVGEPFQQAKI